MKLEPSLIQEISFLQTSIGFLEGDGKESGFNDEDTSDYFLGNKPVSKTNESRVDLGEIIRDIDELIVINDEAHHIHDDKLAWFRSIQDIHNKLYGKIKKGSTGLT